MAKSNERHFAGSRRDDSTSKRGGPTAGNSGIHDEIVRRLVERVFHQPLIGNVERGQYVEFMVDFALRKVRPRWSVTATWDPWDLVQPATGARIEIKQSAAAQNWPGPPSPGPTAFDIAPRSGRYDEAGEWVVSDPAERFADVYVFAHHPIADPKHMGDGPARNDGARRRHAEAGQHPQRAQAADHRDSAQWRFYVVPERDLPPGQKTISLNPLRELAGGRCVSFDELPRKVKAALRGLDLKGKAAPRRRRPKGAAT